MPFQRELYPLNWEVIVAALKLRAGNRCEQCGACNGEQGAHHPSGQWRSLQWWQNHLVSQYGHEASRDELPSWFPRRFPRVVLTSAHLDQPGGPCRCEAATGRKCGDLAHLQSLCQRCHLRLDVPRHTAAARVTRRRKSLARQPELFADTTP